MSSVFYREPLHRYPTIHRGEGVYLYDRDGRRYLDGSGAENIAAFFAETIVGATLGAVPAAPGYFGAVAKICKQHEILLILDEVMAGCGRSGTYFAFEQEGTRTEDGC